MRGKKYAERPTHLACPYKILGTPQHTEWLLSGGYQKKTVETVFFGTRNGNRTHN